MSTLRPMRRLLLPAVFLLWTPQAQAAPNVSIATSASLGQAPLAVTLTAVGAADSYSWDLGDGTRAEGPVARHAYATGRYTATLTATLDGETAQSTVTIVAAKLLVAAPPSATYGRPVAITGRIVPAIRGARIELQKEGSSVQTAVADRLGAFRFTPSLGRPAVYRAAFGSIVSNAFEPVVRPRLDVALPPSRIVGRRLVFAARVRPADAGVLRVRIWRDGRELPRRSLGSSGKIRLGTDRAAAYVLRATVVPAGGFGRAARTLRTAVHVPYLGAGSHGPSVRLLEERLRELSFALRGVDRLYGHDTVEAVLAFQKVHGLPRTGRVGPAVWSRLRQVARPRARYRGTHLEVSKGRQVLFDVRRGRVVRTVHVSTGATGNTPVGRWRIYRKVGGWDWVLWYPMYFLRGFAVHGYPSVPPYPASHGCVRVPMWIAPTLFADHPHGRTIYVY